MAGPAKRHTTRATSVMSEIRTAATTTPITSLLDGPWLNAPGGASGGGAADSGGASEIGIALMT